MNRDAKILCCTAEILSNIALSEGEDSDITDVVMDEFHYYADRERGVAWQVPLLAMPQTRFLLMSATLGDTSFFETDLKTRTGIEAVTVKHTDRPVPLAFSYAETPLSMTVERLVADQKAPVYVVHFTQAEAATSAQDFMSLNVTSKEEKGLIAKELEGFKFNSPYGPDLKRWLRQGIGLHHAGLLPKYRILVERLAQKGLLKVICGTDTLGVGINVPLRTVLFTRLYKYSGEKSAILTARDFHQIAGRAGRKGFDDVGWVVAQAPEHAIENAKLAAKASVGGRKFVKRQPTDKHFVNYDEQTFQRLIAAQPERLLSRFQVSTGMLLNILSRRTDGCRALKALIRDCHDPIKFKAQHRRRAAQLMRALLTRQIVTPLPEPLPTGARLRVNVDLQEDFSLNHALSLWLLDTIPLLDAESEDYPYDLLTLVESILENPDLILHKQLQKLKGKVVAELKAQGMEYDQRMEELEKLEYPKPLRDFVYGTFNDFAAAHPWVGQDNIRPKSIAREMAETFVSFSEYVRDYDLQRSEGLLLRHLNSAYKVLAQTVPDAAKTDEVRELEAYLGAMVRQVDSSLLEAWEKMQNPTFEAEDAAEVRAEPKDLTRDVKTFTASIRARLFAFLGAWARGEQEAALEVLQDMGGTEEPFDAQEVNWTPERLQTLRDAYRADHDGPRLDPEGRNLRHTYVEKDGERWLVTQMLADQDSHNDWALSVQIDLAASREFDAPVIDLLAFGAYAR